MGSPFPLKFGRHVVSATSNNNTMESFPNGLPSVGDLKDQAELSGFLRKLRGRGIISSGTWRRKYCVLHNKRIYFFRSDDEDERTVGFLSLKQYDSCRESSAKVSRKAPNVFVISASERGFFDTQSAIYFSADSPGTMKRWISAITGVFSSNDESLKKDKEQEKGDDTPLESEGRLNVDIVKTRPRGPNNRRLPGRTSHIANKLSRASPKSFETSVEIHDRFAETDEESQVEAVNGESENDIDDIRSSRVVVEVTEAKTDRLSKQSEDHQAEGNDNHCQSKAVKTEATEGSKSRGTGRSTVKSASRRAFHHNSMAPSEIIWSGSRSNESLTRTMEEPKSRRTYYYSSSSDENPPQIQNGRAALLTPITNLRSRSPSTTVATATVQKTYAHVASSPQVVRRIRSDKSMANSPRTSSELDTDAVIHFIPELPNSLSTRRASSGSSLSTITPEKPSRAQGFSSLQRSYNHYNNHHNKCYSNEPLRANTLVTNGPVPPPQGAYNQSMSRKSCKGGCSKTDKAAGHRLSAELDGDLNVFKTDIGELACQLHHLDVSLSSLRQDVGSVQENVATVRGVLDSTREKVNRVVSQVVAVERELVAILKETAAAKQETREVLEEAEVAKATHEQLREEAKNLVEFLRQVASHPRHPCAEPKRSSSEAVGTNGAVYSALCSNGQSGNGATEKRSALCELEGNQDSGNEFDNRSEISLIVEN